MSIGTLDVAQARNEFPALHQEVAGRPLVYLDNAATNQRPQAVLDAVADFYRRDNSNVHRGVHTLSQRATARFEEARRTVAQWINAADWREVIFTKGCTESLNLVASSWGRANLSDGDVVLVSTMEHHSNIVPWQIVADQTGAKIEPIPVSDSVELDMEWLAGRLDGSVKAVCVKAICNATGTIVPVKEVARLAHVAGAIVVVDGAQALAHQKVDVQDWDADFVAITAHKVYGPMGIGALYGKAALLDAMPPYQSGGGMIRTVSFGETTFGEPPDKFEAGTPNVAGAVGFAAALKFLGDAGTDAVASHEECLGRLAERLLCDVPGVTVHGHASRKAGIVSFTMDSVHPHDTGTVLDQCGVAVRSGHHCCMPLMHRLGIVGTTRASFAMYNTEADVHRLVEGVVRAREIFA
ncbi:MAG: SufS family cysteine desulfurase [Armatimonadetes bacterium]|nr:SufS family cysteine desulfurase [Armatimonadota bacterium]